MTIFDPTIEGYLALSPRQYSKVSEIILSHAVSDDSSPRATLRITLLPRDQTSNRLMLQFDEVQQLRLHQPKWSEFSIAYLSITSLIDRGMENIKYRVHDEEEDTIDFLCASFDYRVEANE
jgi:hypothetical protein